MLLWLLLEGVEAHLLDFLVFLHLHGRRVWPQAAPRSQWAGRGLLAAGGEELLMSVYEALRAGPGWNDSALLVVYDDPGGFFDHVQPPVHAPPPT